MEDNLGKPSERVRMCAEPIIVPYRHDIVELFQKKVKVVQFYCYSFRRVKWSHS